MYSKPRSKKLSKISVVIRKRPINRKELARNEQDIIEIRGRQTVAVRELKYLIAPFLNFKSRTIGQKWILQNTLRSTLIFLMEQFNKKLIMNK